MREGDERDSIFIKYRKGLIGSMRMYWDIWTIEVIMMMIILWRENH